MKKIFILTTIFAMGLFTTKVNASGILYQFDTAFPSDPNPAGSPPWIDASFQDVSPGTVRLNITSVELTGGEFIKGNGSGANGGLFFNLNPADNPSSLSFSLVASNGSFGTPTISAGEDSFKADGDGLYDIQLDFSGMFSANDSITYQITGISGLTAADFAYKSTTAGGSGPFYAAAHVQGLSSGGSTWIEPGSGPLPVPEPPSMALLIVALIGFLGTCRLLQIFRVKV